MSIHRFGENPSPFAKLIVIVMGLVALAMTALILGGVKFTPKVIGDYDPHMHKPLSSL